jgi:copper chaperone NosL
MKTKIFLLAVFFLGAFLSMGSLLCAQDDIAKHKSCAYCGMDRQQFAHSRMLIVYDDATEVGLCSLHCAAVDLSLKLDKTPKTILVADYNTKKLIDAEKAAWVVGGSKPGVMSKNAKWAFENKEDAGAFMTGSGGAAATFEQAISAAYTDMYNDTKMIREKRKMKKMQKAAAHAH